MSAWAPRCRIGWRDRHRGPVRDRKISDRLYIGKQGLESTYGAASSLVVILIWVYYSTQIVLLGAEFTHAQTKQAENTAPAHLAPASA